jgi:HEAT repeat protein
MRRPVPPPDDPELLPRDLLAALRRQIGEPAAVDCCVELLTGADLRDWTDVLPYVGGRATATLLDGRVGEEWARAWGARGLLYVWAASAGAPVVAGLADPFWRVAEHCLKVSTLRELGPAGPLAAELARHDLPRVRAQAIRTLGAVGDTEHVDTVDAALGDPEISVRTAAERALARLAERLDLSGSGPGA